MAGKKGGDAAEQRHGCHKGEGGRVCACVRER
jgi:hypothetical protein